MLQASELDLRRFGVKTARAVVDGLTNIEDLNKEILESEFEFIIARCPSECLGRVQDLERIGFFLTDTLVYYKKYGIVDNDIAYKLDNGFQIRYATETDARALEQRARIIFSDYFGHYHADSRLKKEDCDEVYASWAANSCMGLPLADAVVLIEDATSQDVVAFATLKQEDDECCQMLLVGVDQAYQGKGLLGTLVAESIAWAKKNGLKHLVYSTQITNINAQNGVIQRGFKFYKSYLTLHKWVSK